MHLNIEWFQQPRDWGGEGGREEVPDAAESRQPASYIIAEVESVGGVTSTLKDDLMTS